jgi:hypothetical protein
MKEKQMQIGSGKQGVIINEYGNENDGNGTIGYIEPACDNPQWILWFTNHGDAILYTSREPSGGVLGEPIRVKARKTK